MIELRKSSEPEWIKVNSIEKTREYVASADGAKPSPWQRDEVTSALHAEGSGKCMYCEGTISDVSYLEVEHIRPKSAFPELILCWSNLGPSCRRCNVNKGSYWTESSSLQMLDPYTDPVAEHIAFVGPLAVPANGSSRGENTIRKLKFSTRSDLLFSRSKKIEELDLRLKNWQGATDPEIRELYAEDVIRAIRPSSEFSAALRAFASYRGFPVE